MSVTAKTLGVILVALVGLLAYVGLYIAAAMFGFGSTVYVMLALTAVLFVLVLLVTNSKEPAEDRAEAP